MTEVVVAVVAEKAIVIMIMRVIYYNQHHHQQAPRGLDTCLNGCTQAMKAIPNTQLFLGITFKCEQQAAKGIRHHHKAVCTSALQH